MWKLGRLFKDNEMVLKSNSVLYWHFIWFVIVDTLFYLSTPFIWVIEYLRVKSDAGGLLAQEVQHPTPVRQAKSKSKNTGTVRKWDKTHKSWQKTSQNVQKTHKTSQAEGKGCRGFTLWHLVKWECCYSWNDWSHDTCTGAAGVWVVRVCGGAWRSGFILSRQQVCLTFPVSLVPPP